MTDRAAASLLSLALLAAPACFPHLCFDEETPGCERPPPPPCTRVGVSGRIPGVPDAAVLDQGWAWLGMTDADGGYAFSACLGSTLQLVPRKASYRFTPPLQVVTLANQDVQVPDFTARALPTDHVAEFAIPFAVAPGALTVGPDAHLWFDAGPELVGRAGLDGAIQELVLPTPFTRAASLAAGPDGDVWFTEVGATRFGRLAPDGTAVDWPLPDWPDPEGGPAAWAITAGPDGKVWILGPDRAARITHQGQVASFQVAERPSALVSGADGALWLTLWADVVQSYPDGSQCWSPDTPAIVRLAPGGAATSFPLPGRSPRGLAALAPAAGGGVWFTEPFDDAVGRLAPDGALAIFQVAPGAFPLGLSPTPDGGVWFVETGVDRLGHLTADGTLTEFAVPTAGAGVREIVAAADGGAWFVEHDRDRVGRVTPDGQVSEVELLTEEGDPGSLVIGPDGSAWLLERSVRWTAGANLVHVTAW